MSSIAHPHVVLDGLVLDGAYGNDDVVRVTSAASAWCCATSKSQVWPRLRRHGGADRGARGATGIHHCLDATGGRADAQGLVTGAVERLTVRESEIHTFSGDALQFDPSRTSPGWTDIRLQRLSLWLAPLPTATNGFAAGTVPGENGVDTKTPREGRRSRLLVEDVQAWGFRGGLVNNMAAFNIKERVDAVFDRVTVRDSDIAFRLRGPGERGASARIRDSVVHDVKTGIRYEDEMATLRLERVTMGRHVTHALRGVASRTTRHDIRDLLVLGTALPVEAAGHGRLVGPEAFVDVAANDYRRRPRAPGAQP